MTEWLYTMKRAFRTSVSCGPDKLHEMRFKFQALSALQKAEDEWIKFFENNLIVGGVSDLTLADYRRQAED